MLSVSTLDEIPWKRPIHVDSYSVLSPNGTLTPTPKFQRGSYCIAKNILGTKAVLPASPPLPPRGWPPAGALPLSENLVDGAMIEPAMAKCLPEPSRAIPAGFHHTVVASSATAAAPAYALPKPLTPCSYRAKAAACASEPASRPSADTTAPASALRFIFFSPSENIYVTNFWVRYRAAGGRTRDCRSAPNHFRISDQVLNSLTGGSSMPIFRFDAFLRTPVLLQSHNTSPSLASPK